MPGPDGTTPEATGPGTAGPEATALDWRERFTVAADLALLGCVVLLAALPLLTAAPAFAAGSTAVAGWFADRRFPRPAELGRRYLRWLLPGAVATLVVAVAGLLLGTDLVLLGRGAVPGGPVAVAVTLLLIVAVSAFAALTIVQIGRYPDDGWRAAARWALAVCRTAPHRAAAPVAVCVVAVLLVVALPVAAPLTIGYALFGLHLVARRTIPDA